MPKSIHHLLLEFETNTELSYLRCVFLRFSVLALALVCFQGSLEVSRDCR
jgi:hypothetical protein